MKSKGEILGIALLLSIGALLLGCTIRPPHSLVALCGHAWRIGGIVGVFFLLAGILNLFHRRK